MCSAKLDVSDAFNPCAEMCVSSEVSFAMNVVSPNGTEYGSGLCYCLMHFAI